MEKSLAYNSVCRRDILCGTNGAATSQAVPRLPHSTARGNGAVSDAFHDVSARKRVVNTQRELVQGAHKHTHAIDEMLRQVMWRKQGSTGRKIATNYLSGTTFILTNDTLHGHAMEVFARTHRHRRQAGHPLYDRLQS